jgi:hypothetical protein
MSVRAGIVRFPKRQMKTGYCQQQDWLLPSYLQLGPVASFSKTDITLRDLRTESVVNSACSVPT